MPMEDRFVYIYALFNSESKKYPARGSGNLVILPIVCVSKVKLFISLKITNICALGQSQPSAMACLKIRTCTLSSGWLSSPIIFVFSSLK